MKYKILFLLLSPIIFITSILDAIENSCPEFVPYTSEPFSCCSQPETVVRYPYFVVGSGPILIIPHVAMGYRSRNCRWGYDASLGFSTVGYVHQLQAVFVRHFYLDPQLKNSSYFGIGAAASCFFVNGGGVGGLFAPDFVYGKMLGKQGERKRFIEFHLQIPNCAIDSGAHVTPFPLMYIKYGTSF